jgi:hypothetical protein
VFRIQHSHGVDYVGTATNCIDMERGSMSSIYISVSVLYINCTSLLYIQTVPFDLYGTEKNMHIYSHTHYSKFEMKCVTSIGHIYTSLCILMYNVFVFTIAHHIHNTHRNNAFTFLDIGI